MFEWKCDKTIWNLISPSSLDYLCLNIEDWSFETGLEAQYSTCINFQFRKHTVIVAGLCRSGTFWLIEKNPQISELRKILTPWLAFLWLQNEYLVVFERLAPFHPKYYKYFMNFKKSSEFIKVKSGGDEWYAACGNGFPDRTGFTIKDFYPWSVSIVKYKEVYRHEN